MRQIYIAVPFAITVLVLIVSLIVRTLFVRRASQSRTSRKPGLLSANELVKKVADDKGFPDLEVHKGGTKLGGAYHSSDCITLPTAPDNSLLTLAVAAHELAHVEQKKKFPVVMSISSYIGVAGNLLSYTFIPLLALGFLFYWPFVFGGLLGYLLIVLFALLEVPVEIDASRRALSYLNRFGRFEGYELDQLKGLLRLAIFTRVTILTVGFLDVFYNRGD